MRRRFWYSAVLLGSAILPTATASRAQEPATADLSYTESGTVQFEGTGHWPGAENRNGNGCCRCRKTLFHWPCAEISYVNGEGEDEPLATDRPDFTEASSTVGLCRSQVEFGYTFIRDDEDGVRLDAHSYPELLYRQGLFAEWFEIRVGWNYANERTIGGPASDTLDGAEDLYLGAKIALFEQDGWLPEMAIMPQMTVPTGAGAFTADEVLPGVNLLYSWDISEDIALAGSTQGNRAFEGGDYYDEYAQSLSLGLALTEKVGMYHEFFAFFPHAAEDVLPEYYYNAGFTYLVHNGLQLDWRAGVGLNDAADDFFTGAGAAIRF